MMTPKENEAFEEGYKAGYNDDGTKCPYPENSDEEDYWLSGYSEALDGYSRSFDM
jgi:ribosome modulation factor